MASVTRSELKLAPILIGMLAATSGGAADPDPYDPQPMSAQIGATPGGAGLETFCADAEKIIAGSDVVPRNVVHETYAAFVKSKPQADPLETEQINWFEDAARQHPRMISCKLKTADHIASIYGKDRAGTEARCEDVNRATLHDVTAGLPGGQRAKSVVLEPEELMPTGPQWLAPAPLVSVDAAGALHVHARAYRVDWTDQRFASAPPQLRGSHYCHLVSPDYLRRLITGAVAAPAAT